MRRGVITSIAVLAIAGAALAQAPRRPGDVIRIRGVDVDTFDQQGANFELSPRGNDFRCTTPVLLRGQTSPARVDPEKLRQRKIRCYRDGTLQPTFLEPENEAQPISRPAVQSEDEAKPDSVPLWKWVVLAALVCMCVSLAKTALSARSAGP